MPSFALLFQTVESQVTGRDATILALVKEIPAIITSFGALVGAIAATIGALQSRRNYNATSRVETQTNGHLTRLYTENSELQKMVTTLVAVMPRTRPSRSTDPQPTEPPPPGTEEVVIRAEELLNKVKKE